MSGSRLRRLPSRIGRRRLDARRPRLPDVPPLLSLLLGEGAQLATVTEYARQSGLDAVEVTEHLAQVAAVGAVSLDVVGDQLFVNTAPHGRPGPADVAQVPANLWEVLRERCDADDAYRLWTMGRQLEADGWVVLFDTARGDMPAVQSLAVQFRTGEVAPLLLFPSADAIAAGQLDQFDSAHSSIVIACAHQTLDVYVTAVRLWFGRRRSDYRPARLQVVLLEGPAWRRPVLLDSGDSSVAPRTVTVADVQQFLGGR